MALAEETEPQPRRMPVGSKQKQADMRPVRPPAGPAQRKARHTAAIASLVASVILPSVVIAGYLFFAAADRYASRVGFAVRTEEMSSAVELLGGLSQMSGTTSSDTDILYEYIQSQQLVEQIDRDLNLRAKFSKPNGDPIFSFDEGGSIEDLVDYWGRMVKIFYDSGTGLIELRVQAFEPEDAQGIAQAIFNESSAMINRLSAIARQDATRYANEELQHAIERLKRAREATSAFRSRTQIIDPEADIQGQMGLLNTLQQQLAAALIDFDLLRGESSRESDPRLEQAERRIEVIRSRIRDERQKFSAGEGGNEDYVEILGEFERLAVDRQFAEQAYTAALTAYDAAQAEAQRQSRYLAAYIEPTLAQSSEYPKRLTTLGLATVLLFLAWAIGILIYYSIRDRR